MPESAILKIYGDIGEPDMMAEMLDITDDTISAKFVSDFLDENKSATEIIVKINSRGGDVQAGWAIYDLLTNSGKKIKTIGEGKVYSIATIIFLAGSEREFMQNADGLIHNPFIPEYTLAGKYESGDLNAIAESLRQEEKKILDLYVSVTGSDEATLAEYMSKDTKLSATDMLKLGFATKILEPVKAYAYMKLTKKSNIMSTKMTVDEEKSFWEKGAAVIAKALNLSRIDPINQTLIDKDGNEFKLEKESGAPAVGDKATPDGTFVMEDGKTITIAGGEVTKVDTPAVDKTELELANEKIADLEAKIAESETAKAEATTAKEEAETAKTETEAERVKMVAITTELQGLKNSWRPEARSKSNGTDVKVGRVNISTVGERRKASIAERETINNKNQ